MGKEARVGAGFWGSALTVKRDLGLGEGRSALCLVKDVTRRPLLIKGRNSSGPEFRGWAPRDLTPYYVLFPLLKCIGFWGVKFRGRAPGWGQNWFSVLKGRS